MQTKAIFAGSFDPFTRGHLDIVHQASQLFDEVIVVMAINSKKTRVFDKRYMLHAIDKTMRDYFFNVKTIALQDKLVADYAVDENANVLVRGVRNVGDFMYEEEIAKVNDIISEGLLKTIYLRPREKDASISSTMVRELFFNGHCVEEHVPIRVLDAMRGRLQIS